MIQAARNNIIVKMQTKWIGNFSDIMRNAQLDPSSKLNPADLVQIVGEVVSVPKTIWGRVDYRGYALDDICVGDTIIFRHDVVFSFAAQPENDNPVFKNAFWYHGQEYWAVDILKAFAVVRNEEVVMLNGYVMVETPPEKTMIVLPNKMKRMLQAAESTVRYIGNMKVGQKKPNIKSGDKILFHPSKAINYQINEKKFSIIKVEHIFGVIENPN